MLRGVRMVMDYLNDTPTLFLGGSRWHSALHLQRKWLGLLRLQTNGVNGVTNSQAGIQLKSLKRLERETGLEPEDIRSGWFQWVLTGLFSVQPVRRVSPCFSVYRRLVITRLSRDADSLALFQPVRSATILAPQWGHPNQKPLGVISRLVSTYSVERASILDPFCGSGTTLVAARNLGRSAVGIEIEERYCELAAQRLSHSVFHQRESVGCPEELLLSL
jgi:hypothetical protein